MNTPPPLFLFPDFSHLENALKGVLSASESRELEKLYEMGLPPISSVRSLALITGLSPRLIGSMAKHAHRYYRQFELSKGSRGTRIIHAPKVALKVIQKWFGAYLSSRVQLSSNVHGFVPGRSTYSAAATHFRSAWVISVDIKEFFPSVTKRTVFSSLLSLGYSRAAAHLIADLCTLSGSLPQGSPASPVLANLALAPVDTELQKLAEETGVRITRYADDISVSGVTDTIPSDLLNSVKSIITRYGWQIAEDKTEVIKKPQIPKVLGLLVDGEVPKLGKSYRNKIRMMRYMVRKGGLPEEIDRMYRGHISYADSISR